jgi:hypothetical protein
MTINDIPELPGYITVAAVADKYGLSKGMVYYLLYTKQAFGRPYKVSRGASDERPLILLDTREVDQIMEGRKAEMIEHDRASAPAEDLRQWNLRVKDWGRSTGWDTTRISVSGQPGKQLVAAYQATHADDPRPV